MTRKAAAVICAGAVCACLIPAVAEEMNMVKLHVDSFQVVGIEVRTSNAREQTAEGAIPTAWKRLMDEDLLNRIPNRVDSHTIAMYSDYENGKDGLYTYLLGAKVSSANHIPAGMISRTMVSGPYAMFTAKGDASPQMVVDLWKRIWSLEKPGEGQLHRAYKTDFEVYYRAPEAGSEARVDVYVGLARK